MRLGVYGVRFAFGNAAGLMMSIQTFDLSGYFVLSFHDFGLGYNGRALAVGAS
jgi:hypothetical protein